MESEALDARLKALVQPELAPLDLVLHGLTVLRGGGRLTLRFTVEATGYDPADRGSGATVSQITAASRLIGRLLEAEGEDFIPGKYLLEVSSPGIFRTLESREDFRRHVGQRVRIRATVDDKALEWHALLQDIDDTGVHLDSPDSRPAHVAWGALLKARLDPDLGGAKGAAQDPKARRGLRRGPR